MERKGDRTLKTSEVASGWKVVGCAVGYEGTLGASNWNVSGYDGFRYFLPQIGNLGRKFYSVKCF